MRFAPGSLILTYCALPSHRTPKGPEELVAVEVAHVVLSNCTSKDPSFDWSQLVPPDGMQL